LECEERVRRELGNAAYEEGLRAGRRLDPATAVERALAGGGPGAPVDAPGTGGVPAPGGPGGTRRPAASRMTGRGGPERW
ncbi:regulator, partial [Streptomyces globisporus]